MEQQIKELVDALQELVAEFDARSDEAAMEPGCNGLVDTYGIEMARELLKKHGYKSNYSERA